MPVSFLFQLKFRIMVTMTLARLAVNKYILAPAALT